MLLIIISFIAGTLTILAPCVLPLLPVIIGGSVASGEHKSRRPYIIAASLATSLIGFTLLLKASTVFIAVPPFALTTFSGVVIASLGLVSIFPVLWERIVASTHFQAISDRFLRFGVHSPGKLAGPILVGLALGPIFSSCSPTYAFILASVLPRDFLTGLVYLVSYSIGLVAALLAVSVLGQQIISRYSWAVDTHSLFRRLIGLLFLLVGVAILTGWDIRVETWIDAHIPFNEATLEQTFLPGAQTGGSAVLNVPATAAPQFAGLTDWINSPALTISGLKGQVVLVDFWTYSCINCLRSVPYVEKWYNAYKNDGFVVVGVNTPEFAFEHVAANVAAGVKANHITYPVALDNDYLTWDAFSNNSWPADYLIDKSGNIRYTSIGEGDYDKTEKAIQTLLGITKSLTTPTSVVPITQSQTPETYFGTDRAQDYAGSPDLNPGAYSFKPKSSLSPNTWTLSGDWNVAGDKITSNSDTAGLTFAVQAKDVYIVASSQNPHTIQLTGSSEYGPDAPGGQAPISDSRLYHILSKSAFGQQTLTLTVPKGVSLYTFTFGS
jgi:cytochrome c biogenesis protein CcdA/thiol-disulfide isomerase/thioredoxin